MGGLEDFFGEKRAGVEGAGRMRGIANQRLLARNDTLLHGFSPTDSYPNVTQLVANKRILPGALMASGQPR